MPDARDAALALFQQGRWAEAESALADCLLAAPEDVALLRALSQLRFMAGRLEEALALMDRLLSRHPEDAAAHNSRGAILTAAGRSAEAVASFDAALRLDPALVRAHANRAVALAALGRCGEALQAADAALAREPGHAGALASRGMALLALGRAAEAVPALERAVASDAANLAARLDLAAALVALERFADALATLGPVRAQQPALRPALLLEMRALHGAGRFEEALALCRRMRAADPGDADAALGEGHALVALGRYEEALSAFARAVALRPDDPVALNNLGNALSHLGHHEEALARFDRALALAPQAADAHANRGLTLVALRRREEALAAFDTALARDPDALEPLLARADTLLELGRMAEAAEALAAVASRHPTLLHPRVASLHARRQLHDWRDEARLLPGLAEAVIRGEGVVQPLQLLALVDSPAAHQAAARAWSARQFPPSATPLWRGERYEHGRIRVAYLSADLRDHAVAHLAAGVFERHDRARFETIGLAIGEAPPPGDAMRARLRRGIEYFHDVGGLGDEALARRIRDMEVDILVDLGGHTRGGRMGVLGWRPAPVQVAWLGYPGTTGAPYIDYLIADPVVVPAADHIHYAECVVTLPGCYLPADDRRAIGPAPTRATAGLPETGFVFCAFNARHKIGPATWEAWMRILGAVPGSLLWLSEAPAEARANLQREAAARGVAAERLVFAPNVPMAAHLARHACADLFLDTLPYNAHTTASDALWAGLPVVTTPGSAFPGRVAASLLTALGLEELIAPTPTEYEAMAVALAQDPARLAAVRARLAAQRRAAPAFDTDRFRTALENAFVTMHARTQAGLPPAAFAVEPG